MLEMINRARLDPTAEGDLYGITVNNAPVQPLAFNELLIDSALSHSQWMIDENKFQHTGGYCWRSAIEITNRYPEIKF